MPTLSRWEPLEPPLPPQAVKVTGPQSVTAPLLLVDPVDPQTGALFEEVELFLWELRGQPAPPRVGFHLTYWPAGLAYGPEWGIEAFLYHPPTFQALHGFLPPGDPLENWAGWQPPPPWRLLAGTYRPTADQVAQLNAFLATLQNLRRLVRAPHSDRHTFFRTETPEKLFLHFSLSDLETHLAALRR
ncbi:MAG: hypothetical protein D6750_00190 [Bacteroidetes bacterium]|nr:MAG: hypothetical protein D6750_00190 [Bacteroidota bacterium]